MAWKRPVSPPAVLMRLRLNKHLPLGGASTCHKPRRRRALEADTWGLERARAPGNKPRSRARQRTAPPGPGVHGQHCGGCTCPKQQEQACPGGPCSPTGPNATPGRSVFGRLDRRTQVLHEARNSPARKLSQGPLSRSIKSTDRLHRSRERAAGDRRGCLPPPRFLSVVTLQGPQVSASHWEVCTLTAGKSCCIGCPSLDLSKQHKKTQQEVPHALRTPPWGMKTDLPSLMTADNEREHTHVMTNGRGQRGGAQPHRTARPPIGASAQVSCFQRHSRLQKGLQSTDSTGTNK